MSAPTLQRETYHVFIARCPKCRRIFAAALDSDRMIAETGLDVAGWVRGGNIVEYVTTHDGVKVDGCACGFRSFRASPETPPMDQRGQA